MKTIVRKSDNISLYLFADDKKVTLESDKTVIGPTDNPDLYIADCNSNNVNVHTSVDNKSDYWGWKYKHDGSSWSVNSDFKGNNILTSDINNSVTTIPVGNTNPFTASGTVKILNEQITYTGVDGTNLTGCTRGANSTSAAAYLSGELVEQI
tara:strand:- start:613 stop:1068 length:456 start_codon:yes stop_codon:yes gene_type:complete